MAKIAVFGAGGRAGRRTVAEAVARGHEVTAVVRDPAAHPALAGPGVAVVAGDATDAASVASAVAGHDAVVSTVARMDVPAGEFFPAAARGLAEGLGGAGVRRLVLAGIGGALEVAPGTPLHDLPEFAEMREFSAGHASELDVLRAADERLDWVVLAPPAVFLDEEAPAAGAYRTGDHRLIADAGETFAFADLAVALVDEATEPKHHRALVAVAL
jgi:putative NADH-flavin reductase